MSDLYEDDIALWSEQQGDLLRRLARGEKVNEQIDWANVAEEIETVGRNERRACESHLIQALIHELEVRAWPNARAIAHWESESRVACFDAQRAYSPSMRRLIDIEKLYATARDRMPRTMGGRPPGPLPDTCPFTLDELLSR